MKKYIKYIWIDALTSGKYTQGTGTLKNRLRPHKKDRHCCLGVLCDLHHQMTGKGQWFGTNDDVFFEYGESFTKKELGRLPKIVQEWAGLKSDNPRVMKDYTLSYHNDSSKLTFRQIAELIYDSL